MPTRLFIEIKGPTVPLSDANYSRVQQVVSLLQKFGWSFISYGVDDPIGDYLARRRGGRRRENTGEGVPGNPSKGNRF